MSPAMSGADAVAMGEAPQAQADPAEAPQTQLTILRKCWHQTQMHGRLRGFTEIQWKSFFPAH